MPGYLASSLLGLPSYKDNEATFVVSARETLYKAILMIFTVTAILWMSVFLYATFYYSYMPTVMHSRPVHLQFSRSCDNRKDEGMCNFPRANVTLTKRTNLLMYGQPYRIVLELEMPESQANRELGMFLVCIKLKDRDDVWVGSSCRSAMLQYKSELLRRIIAMSFAPLFISGSHAEKQMVPVELFSNFEEDPERPITEAAIEIQSQYVEIYRTHLRIYAHFTGLRYFMFHWPVLSAFFGISTNLFFLAIIACLSWYKFFTPREVTFPAGYDPDRARELEERRALIKQRQIRERGSTNRGEASRRHRQIADTSVSEEYEPELEPVLVTASRQRKLVKAMDASVAKSRALLEQRQPSAERAVPLVRRSTTVIKQQVQRRSSEEFVVLPTEESSHMDRDIPADEEASFYEAEQVYEVEHEPEDKDGGDPSYYVDEPVEPVESSEPVAQVPEPQEESSVRRRGPASPKKKK